MSIQVPPCKVSTIVIGVCAVAMFAYGFYEKFGVAATSNTVVLFSFGIGSLLIMVAVTIWRGGTIKKIQVGKFLMAEFSQGPPPRHLEDDEKLKREEELQEFLSEHNDRQLPGCDARQFDVLENDSAAELLVRPSAYPETPMYMLDKDFRIVDWNEAFGLAFDRTMEGRVGESVLEWTYFLDNFQEVLEHGTRVFGNGEYPTIDVETVKYTSMRYGPFEAVKRAYQIPNDCGAALAWLVTMDLKFAQPETAESFRHDLARQLSLEQLWSEYVLSYDAILKNTHIYPQLLSEITGETGALGTIGNNAKVLDLGAGTGNLSLKLMNGQSDRLVVALEKNRSMLQQLTMRCHHHLRNDDDGAGIIVRKQDVTRLRGLRNEYFDYALMNNVLYALEDPETTLKSVHRVLKSRGELRLSNPHQGSDPDRLFSHIEKELKQSGKFDSLARTFEDAYEINKYRLRHLIHRWTVDEQVDMLERDDLFTVNHICQNVYAGESVLISATKRD